MLKIDLRNEGNEYYIKKYQKDDFIPLPPPLLGFLTSF